MIGKTRTSPTPPNASGDFVSKYTCQLIATSCICEPVTEIIWPIQRRRKSRWRNAEKEDRFDLSGVPFWAGSNSREDIDGYDSTSAGTCATRVHVYPSN